MRRVLGHVIAAAFLAVATLAGSAGAALACEPYTFDDHGFRLERGVAWAFRGHVDSVIPGATGQGPVAAVFLVDRTLAGLSDGPELSIAQDEGCDGFHYGPGDEVIVAVPRYPGFLTEPSIEDRIEPPYVGLTNYTVAVWLLDGERVVPGDRPHSWPAIGGIQPRTATDVIDTLMALPETSTVSVAEPTTVPWLLLLVPLIGSFWVAARRPMKR